MSAMRRWEGCECCDEVGGLSAMRRCEGVSAMRRCEGVSAVRRWEV